MDFLILLLTTLPWQLISSHLDAAYICIMKYSQSWPMFVSGRSQEKDCLPAWMSEPSSSESECSETDETVTVVPRKRLFESLLNHTGATGDVKTGARSKYLQ